MKKLFALIPVAALAGCMQHPEEVALTPQAHSELEVALAGRVAEPPVACITSRDINNRAVGEHILLFTPPGPGPAYVNHTSGGCGNLRNHALVVHQRTGQLCRGDIARVVETGSGVELGTCVLGDFVPYRRRY